MQVLLQVEERIETTYRIQILNQYQSTQRRIFENIILLGSLEDESVLIFNYLFLGYK